MQKPAGESEYSQMQGLSSSAAAVHAYRTEDGRNAKFWFKYIGFVAPPLGPHPLPEVGEPCRDRFFIAHFALNGVSAKIATPFRCVREFVRRFREVVGRFHKFFEVFGRAWTFWTRSDTF